MIYHIYDQCDENDCDQNCNTDQQAVDDLRLTVMITFVFQGTQDEADDGYDPADRVEEYKWRFNSEGQTE